MKIVFVTFEFVSEGNFGGGLASYLNNITSILSKAGHEITVITLSGRDESTTWNGINVERVRVRYSRIGKPYPWRVALRQSYYLNKRLRKLIRSGHKYDVVQYTNANALGLFRTRIPTVVRLSSDSLLWRNGNIENFDISKEYECEKPLDRLEDMAVKRADAVFGPSRVIANIVSRRTGKQIDIVESPFIQREFSLEDSPYSNLIDNKTYLITYGQLSRVKGAQVIGDAIYDILDKYPDLYYVFAGPGRTVVSGGKEYPGIEYLVTCAKEHADRVIYLGCLPREKLYPVIKGAKAVVLPSRIDNMPNTCIEAMYLEKAVIGTDGASFEQLIEDGESGFLIRRDDPSELIKAVDRVFALSDNDLDDIGRKARQRTEQMNPEKVMQNTLNIYDKVVKEKSK